MSDLKAQLKEIEILFCDGTLPNSAIVRSHSLEILIAFSETAEFIEAIPSYPELLKTILAETNNATQNYKALILLVNLSTDLKICDELQRLGAVAAMYRNILVAMKKIDWNHLQLNKSLLELSTDQVSSPAKINEHDIREYSLSNSTVSIDHKQLILELDAVKLSLMIMTNLAALSPAARKDLVQKGSVYEANNMLLILDWMLNSKTHLLFSPFMNVMLSLSSDEEVQQPLTRHCMNKLMQILCARKTVSDFVSVEELGKLIRNLSFGAEYTQLAEALIKEKYVQNSAELIRENSNNELVKNYGKTFVDVLLGLLTSDKAGKDPENYRFFYESECLRDTLGILNAKETSSKYSRDRIEALEHILSSWS